MPFQIPKYKTVTFINEIRGTNNSPLLFLCSSEKNTDAFYLKCVRRDVEYPCLAFEFICSALARELDLHTPDVALVYIQADSYDKKQLSSYQNTVRPGIMVFASRQVDNVIEANRLEITRTKTSFNNFARPLDLLRIALFDLIVDNRDRNRNNLNLLISQEKKRELIIIDHYNTFGGPVNAGKGIHDSTPYIEGSLLGTEFSNRILCYLESDKLENEIEEFMNSYSLIRIEEIIDNVLDQMPAKWTIPKNLRSQLKQFLSNSERLNEIKAKSKNFILAQFH